MALSGALAGAASALRPCNPISVQCTTTASPCTASHGAAPCVDLARPVGLKRNRRNFSSRNGAKFPLSRTRTNDPLALDQDVVLGQRVRAQAGVGRADGQAEFETGLGTDDNGRKGWSGGQDSKKATALEDSTIYPIMRVYRDDLCTLEVTGDAQAWQAIEAMAADGGLTAAEELSKGRSLMTVETIIPGRSEDHSTISTKLVLKISLPTQFHLENIRERTSELRVWFIYSFVERNRCGCVGFAL